MISNGDNAIISCLIWWRCPPFHYRFFKNYFLGFFYFLGCLGCQLQLQGICCPPQESDNPHPIAKEKVIRKTKLARTLMTSLSKAKTVLIPILLPRVMVALRRLLGDVSEPNEEVRTFLQLSFFRMYYLYVHLIFLAAIQFMFQIIGSSSIRWAWSPLLYIILSIHCLLPVIL